MLQRLLRRGKKKERKGLTWIFDYGGHNFYTIPQMEAACARRYLAYTRLIRVHQLGVSEEDLEIFCREIERANNAGDRSKVGALVHTLKAYRDLYTDNKRVFELANCFILVDDEPLKEFVDEYSILKRALFDTSDQVRFFFIDTTLKYLKNIVELPKDLELGDYLRSREVELVEEAYSSLISKPS